jgi:hypothetical protein
VPLRNVTGYQPADVERCTVVLAFNVQRGQIEGLDVVGRTVVVADTLGWLEAETSFTRTGRTGVRRADLTGLVVRLGGPSRVFTGWLGADRPGVCGCVLMVTQPNPRYLRDVGDAGQRGGG